MSTHESLLTAAKPSRFSSARSARAAAVLCAALGAVSSASAATFIKADNTTSLNLTGSYTTAGTPTSIDTIQIDSTLSVQRTSNLGANLSVAGLTYSATQTFQVTPTTGAALTIGSGGITKSGGASLVFANAVTLGANQTWSIATGTGNLQMNGTFSDGGNMLSVTGTGTGTFDLRGNNTFGSNVTIGAAIGINGGATVTFGGANTYDVITVSNGRVQGATLNNFGFASNFGDGGSNTAITLGGSASSGVFEYTGATASSNRTFNMDRRSNGNSILVSNASSTLTLSGTIATSAGNTTVEKSVALTAGGAGNLVLSGIISDHSATAFQTSLIKTGSGSVTLTNANTFAGGVSVTQGTLLVENTTGSGTGSGSVSVASGAALGGNGTISGSVSFADGAKFVFSTTSVLDVTGLVSFANFSINNLVGLDNSVGFNTYTLIGGSGSISAANLANVGSSNAFDLGLGKSAFFELTGDNLQVVVSASAVPEPSTYAVLAGLGVLGLAVYRRRSGASRR